MRCLHLQVKPLTVKTPIYWKTSTISTWRPTKTEEETLWRKVLRLGSRCINITLFLQVKKDTGSNMVFILLNPNRQLSFRVQRISQLKDVPAKLRCCTRIAFWASLLTGTSRNKDLETMFHILRPSMPIPPRHSQHYLEPLIFNISTRMTLRPKAELSICRSWRVGLRHVIISLRVKRVVKALLSWLIRPLCLIWRVRKLNILKCLLYQARL